MMLLCGQGNRIWHYWAGRYPGSVGLLLSPSYWKKIPIDPWMPFALDNGAFIAFREGVSWDEAVWIEMLEIIRRKHLSPLWVAVPDVVGNAELTIASWLRYFPVVLSYGFKPAFCAQDGMTPNDIPEIASTLFIGGTDEWKFRNLPMWTDHFDNVHCARVNAPAMIERCEELGCVSVDGTGWFREPSREDKIPALERFVQGHRNKTPVML